MLPYCNMGQIVAPKPLELTFWTNRYILELHYKLEKAI